MESIDPNRLLQDELAYEIQIRGITPGATVEEMRKTLRDLLRVEKLGKSFKIHTAHLDFKTESKVCEKKLQEASVAVGSFDGSENQWKKWFCRVTHLVNRIEMLEPSDDDGVKLQASLLQQAVSLLARFSEQRDAKVQDDTGTLITIDPILTSTPTHSQSVRAAQGGAGPSGSAQVQGTSTATAPSGFMTPVPVYKWGLKFSGDVHKVSLNSFLEQVEDFSISRGVTTDQLYNGASELFEGKAKIWYRAVRRSVSCWQELVTELKREFQPVDYTERLWEEIKSRRQGLRESVGMYFANMSNLFSRLSIGVPDETRIKILRRNLLPVYQNPLALTEIHSEQELMELCRKLEAHHAQVSVESTSKRNTARLEPDLSYVESKPSPSFSVNAVTGKTDTKVKLECWNCRKTGHMARNCRSPKRKHCFSCGTPDVIKADCPKCSRSGKAKEGPSGAEN